MIDYAEACRPTENEQPGESAATRGKDCAAERVRAPYAIIWKDGQVLELY